jgi:predicted  nucleic acid-binding Zn-ribbon protein
MEWTGEKLLQLLPIAVSVALPIYVYFRTQRDKRTAENREGKSELTSDIVADGTSIRRDLRAMLKDEQARSDKFEGWLVAARDDIQDLKSKVNNLAFMKITLEREKKQIEQECTELIAEKAVLENKIRDLLARVGDLEKQVKTLLER